MLLVVFKNFVLIMMITLIVHYALDADKASATKVRRNKLRKETLAFRERTETFAAPVGTIGMMANSEPTSTTPKPRPDVADDTPAMKELYDFVFGDEGAESQLDALFAPIGHKSSQPDDGPKPTPAPPQQRGGDSVMFGRAYEVIGALDAPKDGPAPMDTDAMFSGLL